ncbi:MAG: hypothetical protein IT435_05290 [Phycisphaerales bacterium]|nr:hypothetical protein [Phycisphaerales bacterium]
MKRVAMFACLMMGLAAGCSSVPSGIDPSYHTRDSRLLGDWTATRGAQVEVSYAGGDAFRLEVEDSTSEATYRGHLLDIAGKKIAEVSVYQPDRSDAVPVYHYAMVEINGDTMTHRPLKAEWLAEASKSSPGAVYKSTAEAQPGSGGLVVRDGAAMLEVLRKAAGDEGAWGAAETLTRKK